MLACCLKPQVLYHEQWGSSWCIGPLTSPASFPPISLCTSPSPVTPVNSRPVPFLILPLSSGILLSVLLYYLGNYSFFRPAHMSPPRSPSILIHRSLTVETYCVSPAGRTVPDLQRQSRVKGWVRVAVPKGLMRPLRKACTFSLCVGEINFLSLFGSWGLVCHPLVYQGVACSCEIISPLNPPL